jgi:hypothetical protein
MREFTAYSKLNNEQLLAFKKLTGMSHEKPFDKIVQFGIEYSLNNHGYRSDDFLKEDANNNLLFSGCSFTFGVGVPYEFTWPYQLNKKYGYASMKNLATPGRDYQTIINEIYNYINNFGKPKAILVMFPNLERYKRVYFDNNKPYDIASIMLHRYDKKFFNNEEEYKTLIKYVNANNIYYDFYNAVSHFEDYLRLIKVPFFWTTWDGSLSSTIKGSKIFNNYFELGSFEQYARDNITPPKAIGQNKKYWLNGADYPDPHPGIMEHSFFAEQFDINLGGI